MVGLIFYNTLDPQENTDLIMDLMLKYSSTPFELDNAAYDSMFIANNYGGITDPQRREDAFRFCYSESDSQNCSLLIFNFYDDYSTTVSDSYYQLQYGACNDSFNIPTAKWLVGSSSPLSALITPQGKFGKETSSEAGTELLPVHSQGMDTSRVSLFLSLTVSVVLWLSGRMLS
jgi:hypothetical protein